MGVQATAFAVALTAGAQLAFVAPTHAADLPKGYPNRPVRLIVPFPPGGSNDILGRFLATKLTERLAGHVPVLFSTLTQVLPHQRSGKLRVIATGGPKRAPALPDIPTVMESGVNYEVTIWWGVLGPKGLPPALANGLNATIAKILAEPDTQKRLAAEAAEPVQVTPAEFGQIIQKDIAKWTQVARDAKMQAH